MENDTKQIEQILAKDKMLVLDQDWPQKDEESCGQ